MGAQNHMTLIVSGKIAPDFSLKGVDAKQYSLKELRGNGPVVAAFFKVSCPVCQFTFPFLERLYKTYGGTFLGISQDDVRASQEFARECGVTFPIAVDDKGYPVSNAYALTMVPTIFLIDTDGTTKISSMGFDKRELESVAAELAAKRKLAPTALFRAGENIPAHRPG
jgi:peroxiredoxin